MVSLERHRKKLSYLHSFTHSLWLSWQLSTHTMQ